MQGDLFSGPWLMQLKFSEKIKYSFHDQKGQTMSILKCIVHFITSAGDQNPNFKLTIFNYFW